MRRFTNRGSAKPYFTSTDNLLIIVLFLIKRYKGEFTPIEVSREMGVTNKTIINRLSVLVKNGFAKPLLVNQRIRSYELSDFTRDNEKKIKKMIV